jgi:hypothetical protein
LVSANKGLETQIVVANADAVIAVIKNLTFCPFNL